jgi:hypothetical protein
MNDLLGLSDHPETDLSHSSRLKQKFTMEEDHLIVSRVQEYGAKLWKVIAAGLPGRTARQCRERWVNYLSPDVRAVQWTIDEENLLRTKVGEYGQLWSRLVRFFVGRTDVSLKNHYRKLMRRDHKKECKKTKAIDLKVSIDGEDEGGAYFIEGDQSSVREDWQLDESYLGEDYTVSL